MGEKIISSLGTATRVLVIVGRDHEPGVAEFLAEAGFAVTSESFPVVPEQVEAEHE